MRDSVDRFVENGGRAARFGGNFFWQIRLEDEGRRQIAYKYVAKERDPYMGTENEHLVSGLWDAAPVNRPGAGTFGVNGLSGVYSGLGRCVGNGAAGYTIYRPRHWALAGANLGYGDVLGARSRIIGYEIDGVDHTFEDGLPFPTGNDGASRDISIIGLCLASNIEPDFDVWGERPYIGMHDYEFKSLSRYGDLSPESRDRASRGNGAMISWEKGAGEIFCAATCEWVAGLARGDWQVEVVTRNVMDRFGAER